MGRVQGQELIHGHFRQLGRHFYVNVRGLGYGAEVGPVGDGGQVELGEEALVAENVFQGLKLGNVIAGFRRQGQALIIRGQTPALVFGHGPGQGAFPPVVGGQGQLPVPVHIVEGLEVIQGGGGGGDDVPALIHPPVLLQVEVLPRGWDELPDAGGVAAGQGHGVVGAFHHGQQGQLHGHAPFADFIHDVIEVAAAPLHHAPHVVRPVHVILLVGEDQVVAQIGHGKAIANPVPQVVRGGGQVNGLGQLGEGADFFPGQVAGKLAEFGFGGSGGGTVLIGVLGKVLEGGGQGEGEGAVSGVGRGQGEGTESPTQQADATTAEQDAGGQTKGLHQRHRGPFWRTSPRVAGGGASRR